jgi:hypothetical protein
MGRQTNNQSIEQALTRAASEASTRVQAMKQPSKASEQRELKC